MPDNRTLDREDLEKIALEKSDPEDYYELMDNLDSVSYDELLHVAGLDDRMSRVGDINESRAKPTISAEIDRRYLIDERDTRTIYSYANDPERIAFIEKGETLSTTESNPALIKNMLQLAEDKGWEAVELSGTDKFRREAWFEARRRGLEVTGYEPTEQDLRLAESEPALNRANPVADSSTSRDENDNLALPAISEEGKELRAKELKLAMATLEQADAIKKFPELKEVYELQPSAAAFYRQQGGLAPEQEGDFVTKATDRAIDDLADGRDVPKFDISTYKTLDVDSIKPKNDRDFELD